MTKLTAHQGMLHAYLISLLPGDPDLLDVLQKTNVVLWEKRGDFQPGSNFRAWALRFAYWQARAWMTECKRSGWLIYDDELAEAALDRFAAEPGEVHNDAGRPLTALRLCLAKLKEPDRLIIVDYYQRGKSLAECGRGLGRSADSLKVSLFRIRAALRRCVKSQLAISKVSQ